ncbi:hypothetical protein P4388_25255 [Bacillus thuringiensis]|uniref:DUF4870 domain-containing protein n=1 Tax=Bacillus thuringiensis TaxID=1428 RepID=A0A9X6KIC4_BACTU|nr:MULTISPECIES: hypothetical protein [Bacillus cereus group]MCU5148737.1 hypothetical protein [Bacillus cereus]MCU5495726.1 hypothetical protein [Bacillus cereus]MCU5550555.1 hypothetical protein [Bacillus cereus]MCU5638619.1 hypothetical protein [Bacillus cereus]MCU5700484.1 hypothetical protein [Bacillus cereus]
MNLSQEKKLELMMHIITLLSFIILTLFSITIFYIPLIFYFIFKSKKLRIIAIETAVYQLFTWIIVLIWNTFVMRTLMFSMFHSDMNMSNMSMILWTAPIYIVLTILLAFGPLKGILHVLQEKDFHYPIISKWISK